MSLLTKHSNDNKVILAGKTRRITSNPIGDPTVTVIKQSDGTFDVKTEQWYQVIQVASASYQYVGMTLAAAQKCAEEMRTKFTRTKKVWEYKADKLGNSVQFKWVATGTGTVLDSEISIQNNGGGMYSVTINASCTDDSYTTTPASYTPSWPDCFKDVD